MSDDLSPSLAPRRPDLLVAHRPVAVGVASSAPTRRMAINSAHNDDSMQPLGRKQAVAPRRSAARPLAPVFTPAPAPRREMGADLSPSILGAPETSADVDDGFMMPQSSDAAGPSNSAAPRRAAASSSRVPGRVPTPPPVPDVPFRDRTNSLLQDTASIGPDESYGNDERALNEFLGQHPMLSLEATSTKALQLVSSMFDKCASKVGDVPVVPKSYDDTYLRPPNSQIGERECACGNRCICKFMAELRHGPGTDLSFVGTEFLLPAERAKFLAGDGLPPRRKKCLVCARYFQTWLYLQARTDSNYRVSSAPVTMQAFGNVVAPPPASDAPDLAALGESMVEMPSSASPVSSNDGYKPDAMLFVDEEFAASSRAAREDTLGRVLWKPVVRFRSGDYRYIKGRDGPIIVQVGIGADDPTGTGLGFAQPAVASVAPLSA